MPAKHLFVLRELVEKEASYLKALQSAWKSYFQKLKVASAPSMGETLPSAYPEYLEDVCEISNITGSFEMITQIHEALVLELKELKESATKPIDFLGGVLSLLMYFAPNFQTYTIYIQRYSSILDIVNRLMRTPKYSGIFEKELQTNDFTEFENLIITPIQHIPRYVLLLNELVKSLPNSTVIETVTITSELEKQAVGLRGTPGSRSMNLIEAVYQLSPTIMKRSKDDIIALRDNIEKTANEINERMNKRARDIRNSELYRLSGDNVFLNAGFVGDIAASKQCRKGQIITYLFVLLRETLVYGSISRRSFSVHKKISLEGLFLRNLTDYVLPNAIELLTPSKTFCIGFKTENQKSLWIALLYKQSLLATNNPTSSPFRSPSFSSSSDSINDNINYYREVPELAKNEGPCCLVSGCHHSFGMFEKPNRCTFCSITFCQGCWKRWKGIPKFESKFESPLCIDCFFGVQKLSKQIEAGLDEFNPSQKLGKDRLRDEAITPWMLLSFRHDRRECPPLYRDETWMKQVEENHKTPLDYILGIQENPFLQNHLSRRDSLSAIQPKSFRSANDLPGRQRLMSMDTSIYRGVSEGNLNSQLRRASGTDRSSIDSDLSSPVFTIASDQEASPQASKIQTVFFSPGEREKLMAEVAIGIRSLRPVAHAAAAKKAMEVSKSSSSLTGDVNSPQLLSSSASEGSLPPTRSVSGPIRSIMSPISGKDSTPPTAAVPKPAPVEKKPQTAESSAGSVALKPHEKIIVEEKDGEGYDEGDEEGYEEGDEEGYEEGDEEGMEDGEEVDVEEDEEASTSAKSGLSTPPGTCIFTPEGLAALRLPDVNDRQERFPNDAKKRQDAKDAAPAASVPADSPTSSTSYSPQKAEAPILRLISSPTPYVVVRCIVTVSSRPSQILVHKRDRLPGLGLYDVPEFFEAAGMRIMRDLALSKVFTPLFLVASSDVLSEYDHFVSIYLRVVLIQDATPEKYRWIDWVKLGGKQLHTPLQNFYGMGISPLPTV